MEDVNCVLRLVNTAVLACACMTLPASCRLMACANYAAGASPTAARESVKAHALACWLSLDIDSVQRNSLHPLRNAFSGPCVIVKCIVMISSPRFFV